MKPLNLQEENIRVGEVLSVNKVEGLQLTSLGNSMASGYSMSSRTKPLLCRNLTLKSDLEKFGIDLKLNHISRFENNNDENVFEWIITNKSQEDMNRYARIDDDLMPKSAPKLTFDEEECYYPLKVEDNRRIGDIITSSVLNSANIIIYNGATGSFLDNNTRDGVLKHRLMHGIKRDCTSIEAVLKYIQIINRNYLTNTQVYLCGAPNVGNIPITSLAINRRLSKIAENYANCVYVPTIHRKFFYELDNGEIMPDIHFDEKDYEKFNAQIMHSIAENYTTTDNLIDVDRNLLRISRAIEMHELKKGVETSSLVKDVVDASCEDILDKGGNPDKFLQKTKRYVKTRSPYDFYYINGENAKDLIK